MTEIPVVLDHIRKLLKDNALPPLEGELADIPELQDIHNDLKAIREALYSFAGGDLSPAISVRGIIPGCMKTLQAHLRHMIWQVQMVEQGDFSQHVQFLGEFSTAFNSMVFKMDATLKELRQRENDLQVLADSLRSEIDLRNTAVEALQESESRFKYLASHDPLTGAMNRRSFMERADAEIKATMNRKISCGVVMMDIDHFKDFNDTWGHQAGDEALRHVVAIITAMLRKGDFLGRYGGEEFVFFFDRADRKTGLAIAERVRKAIADSPVIFASGQASISASFGVAMLEDAQTAEDKCNVLESLIRNADLAMYQSKQCGRNKVVCFAKGME